MTKDEALKLALHGLEMGVTLIEDFGSKEQLNTQHKAIAAIYEALAQPEQAPMNYYRADAEGNLKRTDIHSAQPEQEYDYKDLYEKEKRRSAMWLAKYEEVAGPAPKAYPLAQPEQEPVAIPDCGEAGHADGACGNRECLPSFNRSTTPPQRTWVGLTKEERHEISMANRPYCANVMAAHEEELKRRNT